jgi:hypothetical protein
VAIPSFLNQQQILEVYIQNCDLKRQPDSANASQLGDMHDQVSRLGISEMWANESISIGQMKHDDR